MSSTLLAALTDLLRARLPVRDDGFEVSLAADPRVGPAGVLVPLRVVLRDEDGTPVEIKEQEVPFVPDEHLGDEPRALAFARAWVSNVLDVARTYPDRALLLPSDLVFVELLDDPTLRDEHELSAALADPARRAALMDTREHAALVELLEKHLGAGDPYVDAVLALARPSIEIVFDDGDLEDLPIGSSRLGGHPDLPPDFAWPSVGARPLTFIAQFDLAAVRGAVGAAANALPERGWLAFFYSLEHEHSDAPDGGGRVLYFDVPREQLTRRATPAGVEALPLRTVEFEARSRAFPGWHTPFYILLRRYSIVEHWDDYCAVRDETPDVFGFLDLVTDERFRHPPRDRLLGYADAVQSDPYIACAHRAEPDLPDDGYSRAALERAAKWILLFQAESDPDGVNYGDAGTIQFFIRAEDLAARRFDRICAEFQSH